MTQKWFHKAGVQSAIINGFFVLAGGIIAGIAMLCNDWFLQAPRLRDQNDKLTAKLSDKNNEITNITADKNNEIARLTAEKNSQLADKNNLITSFNAELAGKDSQLAERASQISSLNAQLAPFKTIALGKYTGDENQRLQQLASDIRKMQRDLDAIKKYSDVARLNPLGRDHEVAPPLFYSTPISAMLEGTWQKEGDRLVMSKTAEAEKKYREVAAKFPTFPYSYVYISDCLRERKDPSWKEYAHKAIDIFEMTTIMADHNSNHDQMLHYLKQELQTN